MNTIWWNTISSWYNFYYNWSYESLKYYFYFLYHFLHQNIFFKQFNIKIVEIVCLKQKNIKQIYYISNDFDKNFLSFFKLIRWHLFGLIFFNINNFVFKVTLPFQMHLASSIVCIYFMNLKVSFCTVIFAWKIFHCLSHQLIANM